jgi:FAD/FMN-containing dehydrogenase
MAFAAHEARKRRLAEALQRAGADPVALQKDTSNVFRHREQAARERLDVRDFNEVLEVSADGGYVDAEGMIGYAELVDATLRDGVMPAVVPELKSITLGGAAAGVGIEASSFRYGLVHETLLELEVLTGTGEIVLCTPENEHSDLFFGFPNSYGTLGYALRLKALAVPVKPYVRIARTRYSDAPSFFEALSEACTGNADFVEGTVFGQRELYLSIARFVDQAPYTSDYTLERIYYRSIRERSEDYLTARDFIWRWDTDWFWCSKNVYVQNPILRRLLGRKRLNSITYTRIMRWNSRWGVTRKLDALLGVHAESVVQDIDIPLERSAEFLAFLHREIGILPIWICPIRAYRADRRFPLYPMGADTLYVNFGFWDVVRRRKSFPPGHHNRLVERKTVELGGIKSLYSDVCFERDEFWSIYDKAAYDALKARYDPNGRFPGLYEKCVLGE